MLVAGVSALQRALTAYRGPRTPYQLVSLGGGYQGYFLPSGEYVDINQGDPYGIFAAPPFGADPLPVENGSGGIATPGMAPAAGPGYASAGMLGGIAPSWKVAGVILGLGLVAYLVVGRRSG